MSECDRETIVSDGFRDDLKGEGARFGAIFLFPAPRRAARIARDRSTTPVEEDRSD